MRMKPILATLVTIFVGALVPAAARAEAPNVPNVCRSILAVRPTEPQQPVTLKGRVVGLEYGKQQRVAVTNMVVWLRLKTDSGEIRPVYLGSSWYLDRKNLQVRVGDRLEINGVKIPGSSPQSAMTLASTIKKGDRVWKASIPNKPNVAKSCQPI
jgi:hypothetical protein